MKDFLVQNNNKKNPLKEGTLQDPRDNSIRTFEENINPET